MKLRLVNNETYPIERAEIVDGRLEIDFKEKTAEEVQVICDDPGNLDQIELLTDADDVFSVLDGWTKYGGVMLNGEIKTAILSQPANITEKRITSAEATAAEAKQEVKDQAETIKAIEEANGANEQQITDLQLALCEIYEGMEVQDVAAVYAALILKGKKTIDQVPEKLKDQVQAILDESQPKDTEQKSQTARVLFLYPKFLK